MKEFVKIQGSQPTLRALMVLAMAFIFVIGFSPSDPVISFGIGIYGIATLAVIALLILREAQSAPYLAFF